MESMNILFIATIGFAQDLKKAAPKSWIIHPLPLHEKNYSQINDFIIIKKQPKNQQKKSIIDFYIESTPDDQWYSVISIKIPQKPPRFIILDQFGTKLVIRYYRGNGWKGLTPHYYGTKSCVSNRTRIHNYLQLEDAEFEQFLQTVTIYEITEIIQIAYENECILKRPYINPSDPSDNHHLYDLIINIINKSFDRRYLPQKNELQAPSTTLFVSLDSRNFEAQHHHWGIYKDELENYK